MANADDMLSTEDTSNKLSPTTVILNAMNKAGVKPTAGNIRRYIEQMRGEGGGAGGTIESPDETLRFQGKDSGSDPSVGRRGNVSTKIESVETPTNSAPQERGGSEPRGQTSALPTDNTVPITDTFSGMSPDNNLGTAILSMLGLGGAGAGAYGASRAMDAFGNRPPGAPVPTPVSPTEIPLPQDTIDYTQLDPSRGSAMAEPPVSPMTQAMNNAMAPATGVPTVGGDVPPMPDIGPVPPPRPMGPTSSVLPADLGSPPPQTIPSGPNTQVLPQNMPENAPRVPMPNRVGAPPTPADFYHPSWSTFKGPLARAILGHGR